MKSKARVLIGLLLICSLSEIRAQVTPIEFTVAQDGSGDYKTIQEAVNAVRDLSQRTAKIFIKRGTYNEKLVIPSWKTHIALIGESAENTIITGNDHTGKAYPGGKDPYGNSKFGTFTSATVLVQGDDFSAENLTIQNTAGRVGQAVALHIEGDRAIVKTCRILGNQDTLYTASSSSRQYFLNSYIEGTTDFIFGEATVVFKNCTINSLSDSYITAAATSKQQNYGYVFFDCKLTAAPSATKVYLGRPWRPFAKTVFIRTEMGEHIVAEGWNPWKGDKMFPDKEKTTYYAEYESKGPGANNAGRVSWAHVLSKRESKKYTVEKVLCGPKAWNPEKNQ